MNEKCTKCKKVTDYEQGVNMGRRTKKCIECGTITFEDANPGSVNTSESYFNSPTV